MSVQRAVAESAESGARLDVHSLQGLAVWQPSYVLVYTSLRENSGGKEGGKVTYTLSTASTRAMRHTSHITLTNLESSQCHGWVADSNGSCERLSQAASFLASGKVYRKFEFQIVLESDWLKVAMVLGRGRPARG